LVLRGVEPRLPDSAADKCREDFISLVVLAAFGQSPLGESDPSNLITKQVPSPRWLSGHECDHVDMCGVALTSRLPPRAAARVGVEPTLGRLTAACLTTWLPSKNGGLASAASKVLRLRSTSSDADLFSARGVCLVPSYAPLSLREFEVSRCERARFRKQTPVSEHRDLSGIVKDRDTLQLCRGLESRDSNPDTWCQKPRSYL
jgi:hypothetical protein